MPDSYSQRGFGQWDTITTPRGEEIYINESSSAESDAMWLRIDAKAHLQEAPRPIAGIPHGVAFAHMAAHMELEQVDALIKNLTEWRNAARARAGLEERGTWQCQAEGCEFIWNPIPRMHVHFAGDQCPKCGSRQLAPWMKN